MERYRSVRNSGSPEARACNMRHAAGAVVALRIVSSFAWLQSALLGADAKLAPDFLGGAGLVKRVSGTFAHTALTPDVAHLLQATVLPHPQLFAFLLGFGDLAIGALLLLGLFTRLGGALEIVRAVINILVAGGAGADTIGFNAMLITAGLLVVVTGAGRRFGIDRALLERWPSARALRFFA